MIGIDYVLSRSKFRSGISISVCKYGEARKGNDNDNLSTAKLMKITYEYEYEETKARLFLIYFSRFIN